MDGLDREQKAKRGRRLEGRMMPRQGTIVHPGNLDLTICTHQGPVPRRKGSFAQFKSKDTAQKERMPLRNSHSGNG